MTKIATTKFTAQIDHCDGHQYTIIKVPHGVNIRYVDQPYSSKRTACEVFIPDHSVASFIQALKMISQDSTEQ